MALLEFPADFLWGAATASYQVEGAVDEDGRGESIWDRFSHTPGKIFAGHTGDVACDHYHRYAGDIRHMQNLGLRAYRFSIAWPRIFPEGHGRPNIRGLDFYKRLVTALQDAGIRPVATLYHWDLPQALQDQGGWANRDTARWFADYAAWTMERLVDWVPTWITHNEPWVVAFLGHVTGEHAPGLRDPKTGFQVAHHLLLSHGLAVAAFRELGLPGEIGITLNLSPAHPATDRPEDQEAARRLDGLTNRWFLDPLLRGHYPEDILELVASQHWLPAMEDGDLQEIGRPVDFLGVNYYSRNLAAADPSQLGAVRAMPGPGPKTDMGWEVYPRGLYELLTRLHREYGIRKLYVTENGAAYPDRPVPAAVAEEAEGAGKGLPGGRAAAAAPAGRSAASGTQAWRVLDSQRVDYLGRHFYQAWRAIQDGVPLAGYFVWSLLDNFEWAWGYNKRFGLVYVDYETQERIWKDSAYFYRAVTKENGVDQKYAELEAEQA